MQTTHKLHNRFGRLAFATMAALSVPAYAMDITTNVGVLQTYTNSTYVGIINHLAPAEPVGTFFTDHFNFSTTGSTGSSVATELVLGTFLDITNLQVRLFNGTGPALLGTLVAGPVGSGVTLYASLVPNSAYSLQITGTTSGAFGGSYSLAISAIPEADSVAMILAGLGLVGYVVRRNRRLA